ncbi:MAG: hypothetical protein AAF405_06750 [Pseudomonadota bacterium]
MVAKPYMGRPVLNAAAALAAVFGLALLLAGCGGGASMGNLMQGAGGLFAGSPKIAMGQVSGPPKSVTSQLTQALQTAGADRNLTFLPSGSAEADYTLRGYLLSAVDGSRSRISYIWDVNDASGTRVARVAGEEFVARGSSSNPWRGLNSAAMSNIANKTASQLAADLPGGRGGRSSPSVASASPSGGGTTAAATGVAAATGASAAAASSPKTQAAPKPSGVVVGSVTGAPGDGSRTLPAALKKQLGRSGVKVVSRGSNVYTVTGTAKLTSAGSTKQKIRIDWRVAEPGGKVKGTVSQENTIPKGSLNGPWGAIADAAAGAAVPGIKKLVQ